MLSGEAERDAPPPALPPRPRRTLLRWLGAFLLLLLLACGAAGWLAYDFLHSPGSDPAVSAPRDIEVAVLPGATFGTLTPDLVRLGAVRDNDKFLLLLRWMRYRNLPHALKPGRFRLNTGWTPQRVIDQLVNGSPLLDRVTIPEGLPWWETGKRLEAAKMVRFEDFAKVIRDPAFLRHWGIPFDSAEGFLFPDTYLIMRPLELNEKTAKSVVGRLIDNFWRRTAPLWPDGRRPGPSGYAEVRRLVTLASIVERETAVAAERPRVAGVYANRLRIGMLLQADPTTAYGLGEGFDGNLRRRHLDDADNPYNTYKRPGLPPGPICSPGLACLRAAAQPEAHSYLYFVARGEDGSHVFSSNLTDHNRAVRAY
ncbi:MAG TPA: endolytic transglycosylase MltG, partial [Candidatus Bilophila faecipullorum]|nr:endolytic transglycosylase MltG [Candidatus Bilophila faecipullorum]